MGRRSGRLLAAAFVVGSLMASAPSSAGVCEKEEVVFQGAWNTSNRTFITGHGTRNEIENTYRKLNVSTCGYDRFLAWSTSHVRLGGIHGHWVEAGWEQARAVSGRHYLYWFTEAGRNYNTIVYHEGPPPCTLTPGSGRSKWLVQNVAGTYDWKMQLDCADGRGWFLLKTYKSLGYNRGYLLGETGRFGGSGTSMATFMPGLLYKNSGGSWPYWPYNTCGDDIAEGWNGRYRTNSSFDVVPGSFNC